VPSWFVGFLGAVNGTEVIFFNMFKRWQNYRMALMCRLDVFDWTVGLLDVCSHQNPWAVRNHPTRSHCIICWMLSFHNFPNIFPRFVLPSGISFHFRKMFLLAKDISPWMHEPLPQIMRSKNNSYEQQMACVFSAISSTALPIQALWPGYGVRRLSSRHGRCCPGFGGEKKSNWTRF